MRFVIFTPLAPGLLDRCLDKPPHKPDPPECRIQGPAESHTSRATDMCVSVSSLVPPERVQVVDGTRTDDGIEFVDELFDQDGRVRFPGRRPGSIPRPTPLNFPSTVPIRTRPLHLYCPAARE